MENPTPETPQADETVPPLFDELVTLIRERLASTDHEVSDFEREFAGGIMTLLQERGHYLPGCPPALRILRDAESFAGRLMLSNLACRLLNMLSEMGIETPETTPAKRWLSDYLGGVGHGPIGQPMLWPGRLPGICHMLREWGFAPTPTMPPFVARALQHPTEQ